MIPDIQWIKDRYFVQEETGTGGFATVYLASDTVLKRRVVIKILHARLASEPRIQRQFAQEAMTLANLEHPGIVPIYDAGEIEAQPYFVMKYMQGGSLLDRLQEVSEQRDPPVFTLDEVVVLLERIGPALDYIHTNKVVHLDLKPANILYDGLNQAAIADFGIAGVEHSTTSLVDSSRGGGGTPRYSSPEQFEGGRVGRRSDIYSLGIIVYQLLAGHTPFQADSVQEWHIQHRRAAVPNIHSVVDGLPQGVQAVLERMLAKRPRDRYGSVDEVLRDLKVAQATRRQFQFFLPLSLLGIGLAITFLLYNGRGILGNGFTAVPIPSSTATKIVLVLATGTRALPTGTTTYTAIPVTVLDPTPTILVLPSETEAVPSPTFIATSTSNRSLSTTIVASPSVELALPTSTVLPPRVLTNTPLPAPTIPNTPLPLRDSIRLLQPVPDASYAVGDRILFMWEGGGPLQGSEYFDLRVWQEGEPHLGIARPSDGAYSVELQTNRAGTFFWSVAVVDGGGSILVVPEAPIQSFTVHSLDVGPELSPGPPPNPTVTAPPY